jgi:hypothetical protein
MPHADKLAILAYCVSATLKPQLAETNAVRLALAFTEADVAEYWRPTADNYLCKIIRDLLLGVGREVFSRACADKWASAKKGDRVKRNWIAPSGTRNSTPPIRRQRKSFAHGCPMAWRSHPPKRRPRQRRRPHDYQAVLSSAGK